MILVFWMLRVFFITNLHSVLKTRDITLPTKVHIIKAMVFLTVMYRCENWTIKNADASKLWCWRRLLRVPWTSRSSNQSIVKVINPENCWGWNSNTLATWYEELTHWKRPNAGKAWGQEKGMTEDEMAGWHHRLNGMNLSKLQETAKHRGAWCAPTLRLQRVRQDLETEQPLPASLCSLEFASTWKRAANGGGWANCWGCGRAGCARLCSGQQGFLADLTAHTEGPLICWSLCGVSGCPCVSGPAWIHLTNLPRQRCQLIQGASDPHSSINLISKILTLQSSFFFPSPMSYLSFGSKFG